MPAGPNNSRPANKDQKKKIKEELLGERMAGGKKTSLLGIPAARPVEGPVKRAQRGRDARGAEDAMNRVLGKNFRGWFKK